MSDPHCDPDCAYGRDCPVNDHPLCPDCGACICCCRCGGGEASSR